MELNYAMSYRITTLEIEQAAIRAERARMAAEHADMIVRRDGFLRRMLGRLQARRAEVVPAPAPAQAATAPVAPAPASRATAVPAAATTPAPIAGLVSAASVQTEDDARASELVGCGSHAA